MLQHVNILSCTMCLFWLCIENMKTLMYGVMLMVVKRCGWVTHPELWVGRMTLRAWSQKNDASTLQMQLQHCWVINKCINIRGSWGKVCSWYVTCLRVSNYKMHLYSPTSCIKVFLWPWLRFGWFGEYSIHASLQIVTALNFFPSFLRTEGRNSYHVIGMTTIPTLWLNLDLAEFISWLCNLWHADNPLS